MAAPASRKPWILALLISLFRLVLLAMPDASGFVPGMWERIFPVLRQTACKATSQSEEFSFEIGPVLQEAHKVWGRLYEDRLVRQARSHYQMVVGERFEVNMGKQGQIDFLGVGTGAEAWEAFAQEYPVQMCDATCGTLQGPHFLIAEIGLTSATLKKKFKDNARSLKLLQGFVSSLNATGIGAVKCLVYDGADAEDVAESEEGKQFMDEGGILMNIPYLTAETVLAKLEEPAKLREEIGKLGEEIAKLQEDLQLSGTTGAQQTQAFWVQQLCKDDSGGFELVGSAIKITGGVADIYDLKKAIKTENPATVQCDAFQIDIFSRQEDGNWSKEETMSESLRDNDEATPYGYTVP